VQVIAAQAQQATKAEASKNAKGVFNMC